jgi:hypothetical protein
MMKSLIKSAVYASILAISTGCAKKNTEKDVQIIKKSPTLDKSDLPRFSIRGGRDAEEFPGVGFIATTAAAGWSNASAVERKRINRCLATSAHVISGQDAVYYSQDSDPYNVVKDRTEAHNNKKKWIKGMRKTKFPGWPVVAPPMNAPLEHMKRFSKDMGVVWLKPFACEITIAEGADDPRGNNQANCDFNATNVKTFQWYGHNFSYDKRNPNDDATAVGYGIDIFKNLVINKIFSGVRQRGELTIEKINSFAAAHSKYETSVYTLNPSLEHGLAQIDHGDSGGGLFLSSQAGQVVGLNTGGNMEGPGFDDKSFAVGFWARNNKRFIHHGSVTEEGNQFFSTTAKVCRIKPLVEFVLGKVKRVDNFVEITEHIVPDFKRGRVTLLNTDDMYKVQDPDNGIFPKPLSNPVETVRCTDGEPAGQLYATCTTENPGIKVDVTVDVFEGYKYVKTIGNCPCELKPLNGNPNVLTCHINNDNISISQEMNGIQCDVVLLKADGSEDPDDVDGGGGTGGPDGGSTGGSVNMP